MTAAGNWRAFGAARDQDNAVCCASASPPVRDILVFLVRQRGTLPCKSSSCRLFGWLSQWFWLSKYSSF